MCNIIIDISIKTAVDSGF